MTFRGVAGKNCFIWDKAIYNGRPSRLNFTNEKSTGVSKRSSTLPTFYGTSIH